MSTTRESAIRVVQTFAVELLRTSLQRTGHVAGWSRVARATTFEELLLGLGYSDGYAECARLTCGAGSAAWRVADALDNAAKTFAVLLRAPSPVDPSRCVAAFREELQPLLALDQDGGPRRIAS